MNEIEKSWNELLQETNHKNPTSRQYRLLGTKAVGVRASVIPLDQTLELLIEIPPGWNNADRRLPEWKGMAFSIVLMQIPPRVDNIQLVLSLRDEKQKNIFLAYCNDLVSSLEGIADSKERIEKIQESIQRWGRFFAKCGSDGLNVHQQSGLFGELTWLITLIDGGLNLQRAVESWKGCERNFHDFDMSGDVIEVKTTMTKEPQQIIVNNERQLDDRGLKSLHLYFIAISKSDGGGQSLSMQVDSIRRKLESSQVALVWFNDCLINAGYHDLHAAIYRSHFIIKEMKLFRVCDGFPRIIDPPDGIGQLRYGVLISSCRSFDADIQEYIASVLETQ